MEDKISYDLDLYNTEIELRVLLASVALKEQKNEIKDKIKRVTEPFIKCRKCGRTYGTLLKDDYTGEYYHKDCIKDTDNFIRNYFKAKK